MPLNPYLKQSKELRRQHRLYFSRFHYIVSLFSYVLFTLVVDFSPVLFFWFLNQFLSKLLIVFPDFFTNNADLFFDLSLAFFTLFLGIIGSLCFYKDKILGKSFFFEYGQIVFRYASFDLNLLIWLMSSFIASIVFKIVPIPALVSFYCIGTIFFSILLSVLILLRVKSTPRKIWFSSSQAWFYPKIPWYFFHQKYSFIRQFLDQKWENRFFIGGFVRGAPPLAAIQYLIRKLKDKSFVASDMNILLYFLDKWPRMIQVDTDGFLLLSIIIESKEFVSLLIAGGYSSLSDRYLNGLLKGCEAFSQSRCYKNSLTIYPYLSCKEMSEIFSLSNLRSRDVVNLLLERTISVMVVALCYAGLKDYESIKGALSSEQLVVVNRLLQTSIIVSLENPLYLKLLLYFDGDYYSDSLKKIQDYFLRESLAVANAAIVKMNKVVGDE
jgi:hypothetical protein